MLDNFKDNNRQFTFCGGSDDNDENNIKEEHVMRSMLNLLRASSVAYPGETVMEEAKVFSTVYLNKFLEKIGDIYKKNFLKEVMNFKYFQNKLIKVVQSYSRKAQAEILVFRLIICLIFSFYFIGGVCPHIPMVSHFY